MPVMDGFAATQAIRARDGDPRHMPIIALTENALAQDAHRCLAAGMDAHLSKPVQAGVLIEAIECQLNRHRGSNVGNDTPAIDTMRTSNPEQLVEAH